MLDLLFPVERYWRRWSYCYDEEPTRVVKREENARRLRAARTRTIGGGAADARTAR